MWWKRQQFLFIFFHQDYNDYIMMIQWISFGTKEKKMKRRIWNEIDQHTHTQIICIDPFNHYYYEIKLDEWMNEDETTKKNWLTKKDRSAFSVLVWVKKKKKFFMEWDEYPNTRYTINHLSKNSVLYLNSMTVMMKKKK